MKRTLKKLFKKDKLNVMLVFVFIIGLSVMLYPPISSYWNSKVQSRAVASYSNAVKSLTEEEKARISIKQTPQGGQFARNDNGIRNGITFCIGDENMYVLRPNINASFVECNFNNREFYNMIGSIFDQQMQILPNIRL